MRNVNAVMTGLGALAMVASAGLAHAAPILTLTQTANDRDGGTINLTSEGSLDWFQYGTGSGVIRKSSTGLAAGPAVDWIKITAETGSYTDSEDRYVEDTSWTDGTPDQTGTGFDEGRLVSGSGVSTWTFEVENIELIENGVFRYFTYSRGYKSTFRVEVRDMVTNDLLGTDNISVDTNASLNQFNQVVFSADATVSNPQKLVVIATADGYSTASTNFRRFGINAATLGGTIIPEPASLALLAAGGVLMFGRRRRLQRV